MLYIRILEDDMLMKDIDTIFSGLVPHKAYNPSMFVNILNTLNRYIVPDELQGEYHVFYSVCMQLKKILTSIESFVPNLTKEIYTSIITANIMDLVVKPEVRIDYILEEEGIDGNLEIPSVKQEATQILLNRCIDLYNKVFNLGYSSELSFEYITSLKNSIKRHCATNSLYAQSQILSSGLRVGRTIFKGVDGWSSFVLQSTSDLNSRLNDMSENGVTSVNTLEKSTELLKKLSLYRHPLANYGIPPLDDQTPIMKHRLAVLCAKEGTGKTSFAINAAVNLLLNDKRVLFICGETPEEENYGAILSNYIFKKHGRTIPTNILASIYSGEGAELPDEILKLVTVSMKELSDKDLIHLEPTLHYNMIYDELVDYYNILKFDGLFIDHSCSMTGGSDEFENVKNLAVGVRNFKKKYPVYCLVLSQLSTSAKDYIRKGHMVEESPTRGNAILSHEADDVLIMYDTETLKAKECLAIENYKRRLAKKISERMIIKPKFSVSTFIWRDEDQYKNSTMGNDPEKTLNMIDKALGSEQNSGLYSDDSDDINYANL